MQALNDGTNDTMYRMYKEIILWVNGSERYHSAGLYTSDTPMEASEIVEQGDVIRTENMTQVLFTPYRAIV